MTNRPAIPTATAEERAAARKLADAHGDRRAAEMLGLSVDSFLRVLAQRPTRRGTVFALRAGLAALASGSAEARAATG